MEKLCINNKLLESENGLVRVPLMIKGSLLMPSEVCLETVENAFNRVENSINHIKLENAQILREPVIDRRTMQHAGRYIYQVMPLVNPQKLVEHDFNKLASTLYRLTMGEILDYLDLITATLMKNSRLLHKVFELLRITSEYPDKFLNNWVVSVLSSMSRHSAKLMVDRELSFCGKAGSRYLDDWVEVSAESVDDYNCQQKQYVRAMPTRQLHITAGNVPEVPLVSVLRALLTKSAAVIKLPYGAILPGVLFALAAVVAAPDHPITRNLSLVYWQGGDREIEDKLFTTGNFDRIVVWGNPATVSSVVSRALFTKILSFNPRYGISLIGKEAFSGNVEEVAIKACADVMIYNQQACTSSLVHYVEGAQEQVHQYAETLCGILKKADREAPNFVPGSKVGQIQRMRRGRYAGADWYINERDGRFSSGAVVMPGDFDILDHPMCRLVFIKPVSKLEEMLKGVNQFVSTVGVYPEPRRLELRDHILARGVSEILPLGQCERLYPGIPHDGMLVLNQLVDWKNS